MIKLINTPIVPNFNLELIPKIENIDLSFRQYEEEILIANIDNLFVSTIVKKQQLFKKNYIVINILIQDWTSVCDIVGGSFVVMGLVDVFVQYFGEKVQYFKT
jgi:hypothetical protein